MGLPMPAPHVDYMYTMFVTNQGYASITLIYFQVGKGAGEGPW